MSTAAEKMATAPYFHFECLTMFLLQDSLMCSSMCALPEFDTCTILGKKMLLFNVSNFFSRNIHLRNNGAQDVT